MALDGSFLMYCVIWWIVVVLLRVGWLMARFLWVSGVWRFRFTECFSNLLLGFSGTRFGVGGDADALWV